MRSARSLVFILVWLFFVIGYIQCVYKMVTCNWEPIGKAEVAYIVGTCTGLGCVIGWLNIEDK